jgi:hypothetical protein
LELDDVEEKVQAAPTPTAVLNADLVHVMQ